MKAKKIKGEIMTKLHHTEYKKNYKFRHESKSSKHRQKENNGKRKTLAQSKIFIG